MHSTFSPDGNNTIAELCEQAIALGLTHIAVTDHVEWLPDGSHQRPDFARYFDEICACRQRYAARGLMLLTGLELGNPHEHRAEVDVLLAQYDFDVVIGSMHWLGGKNIHFVSVFGGHDPYVTYARYFDEIAQIAATINGGIVAHFDRIFWPGATHFGPPQIGYVEDAVRRAVRAVAQHGCVLELNTRFLTHEPNWNDTLLQVLRWYREEGGTFVAVNSDAHRITEMGRHRQIAAEIVAAAGCTPYTWQGRPNHSNNVPTALVAGEPVR